MPSSFPLEDMIESGFTASQLLDGGVAQVELDKAGLSLELAAQGKKPDELRDAKCTLPAVEDIKQALGRAGMPTNTNLMKDKEKLDASKKDLTDEDGAALIWAVACFAFSATKEIILARTDVGNLTAVTLGRLLRCSPNVMLIDLHDNAIKDEGAIAIANSLRFNSSLVALRLSENHFSDSSAKAFARALIVNSTLQSLTLDKGPIPVQQVKGQVEPVSHVLDLSATGIGHLSTVVICELIQHYQEACGVLYLDRNNVEPEGGAVIANMLRSNNVLQELHLRFCGLKADGVKDIAEALKVNTCLEKLYLIANNIGSDGAQAIVDMLKVNTTLMVVDVSDNRLSNESKDSLSALAREELVVIV